MCVSLAGHRLAAASSAWIGSYCLFPWSPARRGLFDSGAHTFAVCSPAEEAMPREGAVFAKGRPGAYGRLRWFGWARVMPPFHLTAVIGWLLRDMLFVHVSLQTKKAGRSCGDIPPSIRPFNFMILILFAKKAGHLRKSEMSG